MSEHSSGFPVYWRDVMPPSLNQPSPLVKAEALALIDSAFEAEFDLLPEDAKQLCDTFFRGLRKRLGHPVECSGKSSGAVDGGTA